MLSVPATASLGDGLLQVAGTRLVVSPQAQTVPFDTPTVIHTSLDGFDASLGQLPPNLRVRADFTGPEVAGILTLETLPNEPFRIPRLSLRGEYLLDNIRLMDGDDLLAYSQPRSASVTVTQVLVTQVSSRPLTLAELQSYGVVIGDDNFQAFDLAFGFAIGDGGTINYELHVPVLYDTFTGRPTILADLVTGLPGPSAGGGERFTPPRVQPFVLHLEQQGGSSDPAFGGCAELFSSCEGDNTVTLPGALVLPTDLNLLNQFFSVILLATNAAPSGDPLEIHDLTARVSLPPGLRLEQTEPPTYLGTPVPVRVPGADGILGTQDDLSVLIAQATGQAEVLVEARTEGTHVVDFDLAGTLVGLPGGSRPIRGRARGAVAVRDPTLAVTVSHPDVVRAGEDYTLTLTVTNTGGIPVNAVSLDVNTSGLVGVELVPGTPATQTLTTLEHGDAAVVEFRLRPLLTGPVVATAARTGGQANPTFELTVGVGENGIPLSPATILLPRSTDHLSPTLVNSALRLLGLGFSLASAPPSAMTAGLPQVDRAAVDERVYQLAQAGRYVGLGDDPFTSAAVLAAEWTGNRDADWEWDRLRRTTDAGAQVATELGAVLSAQAASADAAFTRFGRDTAFLPPMAGALATGTQVALEVASQSSGKRAAGAPSDPARVRELPFAEIFSVAASQMALLAVPEEGGYEARLTTASPNATALDLSLLVRDAAGTPRRVDFASVVLSAAGVATARFKSADASFVLEVDSDGDGATDSSLAGSVSNLTPTPFQAVAAVQRADIEPSGHLVEVLFSADVDLASLRPIDPSRFELPGNLSNGGLTQVESEVVQVFGTGGGRLRGTRIVRVLFSNPPDPFSSQLLTVRNVGSAAEATLTAQSVALQVTAGDPGGPVEGEIVGAYGNPVAAATVLLWEVDYCLHCVDPCQRHKTAAAVADSAGRYRFDYVRQTQCSEFFEVEAFDGTTGDHALARSRMRFAVDPGTGAAPAPAEVDLHMFGRGVVQGKVTYEDGSIPPAAEVVAYQSARGEGQRALIDPATGDYRLEDVPVGTLSLVAHDRDGTYSFATEELPQAGATLTRNFTLLRLAPPPTAELRGLVVADDLQTPVAGALVALYVDSSLVGVRPSDLDGLFRFGTVPAGLAELEVFDGATGLAGGNLFLTLLPDQQAEITIPLLDERGAVEGYVLQQGIGTTAPIAGAIVFVDGSPLNTVTDAAGYYRLEGVRAGLRRVVAADPATGQRVSAQVTVQAPSAQLPDPIARLDLTVALEIDGGITGTVLDFDGNPVPNATVHLAAGSTNWYYEAFTDLSGQFTLAGLGPGTYSVHAFRGADGTSTTVTIDYAGHTPSATLQFKKGTIEVCVMERDGQGQLVPFTGTTPIHYRTTVVRFGLVDLDTQQHTVQTGQNGAPNHCARFTEVLAGRYDFYADNPFGGSNGVQGMLVAHGQSIYHELEIDSPGRIAGRVLLPDGVTPAAGAEVTLDDPSFAGGQTVTAGADGEFLFALVAPRSYSMAIDVHYSEGVVFRQARTSVFLGQSGQVIDGVELVLPVQGSVVGTVIDSFGDPVAGAQVTLKEQDYPRRTLSANTDASGAFGFSNVFAGGVALSAKALSLGGLGGAVSASVTEEGEQVVVEIALQATAEISGQVLSPVDGSAVAGAEVQLLRAGKLVDRATSDSEGRFHFFLLPLTSGGPLYELCVADPASGRQGQVTGIELTANGQLLDVPITLEARGSIVGTLTEPASGGPVPSATVTLKTHSLIPLTTYSSTGAQGEYSFGGVPQGTFDLTALEPSPGRRRAAGNGEITFEDEQVTVALVLEGTGSVTGSVLNPVGAPAGLFANPNVRILQDGKVIGATLDNPFRFDGVIVERPFTLIADEVGGAHGGRAEGVLTQAGQLLTTDIAIAPIGAVTLRVTQADGTTPAVGADVSLHSEAGYYGHQQFTGNTGASHEITFSQVGEGTLRSYAHKGLLDGSAFDDLTQEGENVVLSLPLTAAGTVSGTVVLSDGVMPAAGAIVTVDPDFDPPISTQVGADGTFEFPAVPLVGFSLTVQENFGPGYREIFGDLEQQPDGTVTGGDVGTLVLDDHDPLVLSIWPPGGATGLPPTTSAVVEFSEPMSTCEPRYHPESCVEFRPLPNGNGPDTIRSWSADGKTLTITPITPLKSGASYELRVWEGRNYDLAGRRLPSRGSSVFTVADVVAPTVAGSNPAHGANQVPVDALLQLTFSEPVAASSLAGGALQLTDLSTGSGITTTFTPNTGYGLTFTLAPQVLLETDRQYRLTVMGATDTSGNAMAAPAVIEFWTPDTTAPELVSSSPAANVAFVAGEPVTVRAEIADERGVASVTLAFGGRSVELLAANAGTDLYEATFPAPTVSAATAWQVSAEATDLFGNVASWQWPLQVTPNPNLEAPLVALDPCHTDGDRVQPGVASTLTAEVADDEGIDFVRLRVDGLVVETVTAAGEKSLSVQFSWTPPTAPAGTSFYLAVEAQDFAGNLAAVPLTVSALEVPVWQGGAELSGAVSGQLALAAGDYTLSTSTATLDTLLLLDGARVAYTGGTVALELAVTGELHIQCGAVLDLSGQGYPGGAAGQTGTTAPGLSPALPPLAGGSHGGLGSVYVDFLEQGGSSGEVYGSVYAPRGFGAGGATNDGGAAGAGGGALDLTVGQFVLGGEISARGTGTRGSGAGGSVRIQAGSFLGSGLVDASGADATWCQGGAGGGGRIAIDVAGNSAFDPATQLRSAGGRSPICNAGSPEPEEFAGAGTVFVRDSQNLYGRLVLRNGLDSEGEPREGLVTVLPELGGGSVAGATTQGADLWVTPVSPVRERWLGAWMALADSSDAPLGSFEVVELGAAGELRLRDAAGAAAAATYQGEYRFDSIELLDGAGLDASDPVIVTDLVTHGEVKMGQLAAIATLTVTSGSTVYPARDGLWLLQTATSITIAEGAMIDATGIGYAGGTYGSQIGTAPAGVMGAPIRYGGSHGGTGLYYGGFSGAGAIFDSVYYPFLGGGGGSLVFNSQSSRGARGGGVLWVETPHLELDGELRAQGERSSGKAGGGAGGTVHLSVGTLSGSGRIDASGGSSLDQFDNLFCAEGPGGGGRIAIYADSVSGFDTATQASVDGGRDRCRYFPGRFAAPGTVFVHDTDATATPHGELIVAQQLVYGEADADTVLPRLGSGTVGAVAPDASDPSALWIEPEDPAELFDLGVVGMWVRVAGADYRVIDQSADRRQILLAGAAGTVLGGESYAGVYKLDRLTLRGGVTVEFRDLAEIGVLDDEGGLSQVIFLP